MSASTPQTLALQRLVDAGDGLIERDIHGRGKSVHCGYLSLSVMNILYAKTHPWTAAALSFGLLLAGQSAMATDSSSTTQSSPRTATQGYGLGMIGLGMMYNWTPEQRQQHWEQMRQMGYGPGMMMGPSVTSSRQTSGQ
jgi:hypothetical protein